MSLRALTKNITRNAKTFQALTNIRTLSSMTNAVNLDQYQLGDDTRMTLQSIINDPIEMKDFELNLPDQQKMKLLLNKLEITRKTQSSAMIASGCGFMTLIIPICSMIPLDPSISLIFTAGVGCTNWNLANFFERYYKGKTNNILQEIQKIYQSYHNQQETK